MRFADHTPPSENWEEDGIFVDPYPPHQGSVKDTFGVTISKTACKIVKLTSGMDDEGPPATRSQVDSSRTAPNTPARRTS